jgi:hypothetical protein
MVYPPATCVPVGASPLGAAAFAKMWHVPPAAPTATSSCRFSHLRGALELRIRRSAREWARERAVAAVRPLDRGIHGAGHRHRRAGGAVGGRLTKANPTATAAFSAPTTRSKERLPRADLAGLGPAPVVIFRPSGAATVQFPGGTDGASVVASAPPPRFGDTIRSWLPLPPDSALGERALR